jgi:PII-like signaling protein
LTVQAQIDLGQLVIAILLSMIGIVGWFIKREITTFSRRLDMHEERFLQLSNQLSVVMGQIGIISKYFRATSGE